MWLTQQPHPWTLAGKIFVDIEITIYIMIGRNTVEPLIKDNFLYKGHYLVS